MSSEYNGDIGHVLCYSRLILVLCIRKAKALVKTIPKRLNGTVKLVINAIKKAVMLIKN